MKSILYKNSDRFTFNAIQQLVIVLALTFIHHAVGTQKSSETSSNNHAETPSYGIDISFPVTGIDSISTNYPWLPHNVDPANNPTPKEYENMPIQVLGNRKKLYEDYIQGCRDFWERELDEEGAGIRACDNQEHERILHNQEQPISMLNYTDIGYKKIKAPEKLFKMISDFWETNKHDQANEKWTTGGIFVNYWDVPAKMVSVENENLKGGGDALHDAIWETTSDIISDWTGQKLEGSSVYGIRVYKEGAILSPHVDRLPLISSAIINVDQDVDEEWPLEVIGHDGKARNITMEPGDMVLYESHSVVHGRPFPLKGRFFANIFIHFQPVPSQEQLDNHALPPYILKDSVSAKDWEEGVYEGEIPGAPKKNEKHESHDAAGDGDLDSLIRIAKEEAHALHAKDSNGWEPIHEAVRSGHEEVIMFLREQGVDMNAVTSDGSTVLDLAVDHWGHEDDFIEWLNSIGASVTHYDLGPEL